MQSLPPVGPAQALQPHWPTGPVGRVAWALQVLCKMCACQLPEQTHWVVCQETGDWPFHRLVGVWELWVLHLVQVPP